MTQTFSQYIADPKSEKIVIALISGKTREFGWSNTSGTIYKKTVSEFAIGVKYDDTNLTEVGTASPSTNEWHFDADNKELYINIGADPSSEFITVTSRYFFANRDLNMPYDLSSGREVFFEGRLKDISSFTNNLDNEEQVGISLSGSGKITLDNNDGFFNNLYEKVSWENQNVEIYSWSPTMTKSTAQLIFKGFIDNKNFSNNTVIFSVKDLIEKLRDNVPLGLYSSSDGTFDDSYIGNPKRRIYGRVNGLILQPLDQILEGFTATGTFSGSSGGTTITGSGSSLLSELKQGDTVKLTLDTSEEIELSVSKVVSDTSFTTYESLTATFIGLSMNIEQERAYSNKNRQFQIAGHALREPSTTITTINESNRLIVGSTSDLEAGDTINIDGQLRVIRRIVGNEIVLQTNLSPTPSVGATVTKQAVQSVFYRGKTINSSDYSVTNTSSKSSITFTSTMERNISAEKSATGTIEVTNASRNIIGTNTSFKSELRVGDYIKAQGTTAYYQVLNINSDTDIDVTSSYADSSDSGLTFNFKTVDFIEDDDVITCNCFGITEDGTKTGTWIKTASQVVEHLLTEAGLSSQLNTASFSESESNMPFLISLAIPKDPSSDSPTIRDIIGDINSSVFGSLYFDNDFKFKYSTLNSNKPSDTITISEDDVISYSIKSDGKNIVKDTVVRYQHFDADKFTSEDGAKVYEFENVVVKRLVETSRKLEKDIYLYNEDEAQIIAQRNSLFRESPNTLVDLKSKLQYINKLLNDAVYLVLDRIFKPYGNNSGIFVGLISKISKNGLETQIEVNNLGRWFEKVANIAPAGASDFTGATDKEKIFNGYIVDASTELVNSDQSTYRTNLLG